MKANKKTKVLETIQGPLKNNRTKVVKKFGIDFKSPGGALTLDISDVSEDDQVCHGVHTRTHADGWTIKGEVISDYFSWVNEFKAQHPVYGTVKGDFEKEVIADSEAGFKHFYKHHPPTEWNYLDI